MNLSPSCVHGYLKRLQADGWLRIHSGNLTIVSQKEVANTLSIDFLKNFEVGVDGSIQDIVNEIRLEVFARKHRQSFYKSKNTKSGGTSSDQEREKRSRLSMFDTFAITGENCYEGSTTNSIQISYEGLSHLLGMSISGAFYFMKGLEGKIVTKHNRVKKLMYPPSLFKDTYVKGIFVNNGVAYKQLPNVYEFIN